MGLEASCFSKKNFFSYYSLNLMYFRGFGVDKSKEMVSKKFFSHLDLVLAGVVGQQVQNVQNAEPEVVDHPMPVRVVDRLTVLVPVQNVIMSKKNFFLGKYHSTRIVGSCTGV